MTQKLRNFLLAIFVLSSISCGLGTRITQDNAKVRSQIIPGICMKIVNIKISPFTGKGSGITMQHTIGVALAMNIEERIRSSTIISEEVFERNAAGCCIKYLKEIAIAEKWMIDSDSVTTHKIHEDDMGKEPKKSNAIRVFLDGYVRHNINNTRRLNVAIFWYIINESDEMLKFVTDVESEMVGEGYTNPLNPRNEETIVSMYKRSVEQMRDLLLCRQINDTYVNFIKPSWEK